MTLQIEGKKAIVAEVAAVAANALSAVAAEYRGLTVSEITELRTKARQNGVYLRVVRNTLARRAVENTEFSCLQDVLVGPLMLAFSESDPGAAARLMRDFVKDHENLQVKALALGGKLFAANELEAVASLPTREQALSMLMSVMQAPIVKLVRTLAEPPAKLARVMAAVRDKKQAGE